MYKEWFSWFFSGDVFVGRMGKNTNRHNMNMFGHFIVKAVFLQLIEDYKIDSSDTKVQSQFCNSNTTVKMFFLFFFFFFCFVLDLLLTLRLVIYEQICISSEQNIHE